ncbi:hypothetical protein [Kaarinaea lacus]
MFNVKTKYLSIVPFMFFISSYAMATENAGMSAFYADDRNKQAFNNAVKGGMLAKSREQMMVLCEKEKEKNKSMNCECIAEALNDITDEEMFYESVTSYREYQERVQAAKDNDQEKLEQLKQKHAKRIGLGQKIDKACSKK